MKTYIHSNRTTKAILVTACLFFLGTVFLSGCEKEEIDPAKQPIARAIKAIGGMKRASGWTTRTEKGLLKVNWPGWGHLQADCSRFVKKPDKIKIDRDFSAYDHPFFQNYYYNAGEGWYMVNLNSRQSPQITERLKVVLERIDDIAYYAANCDTFFLVPDVPDDSLLAGATFERVGCIHDSDTVFYDIDRDTHLPVRKIEDGTTVSILEDYRKTCGLKVPFMVTIYENGRKSQEYIWKEITFNKEISDDIFEEYRPPKPPVEPGEEES
jgi:hypothetical protein